jgi:hypothetical protein
MREERTTKQSPNDIITGGSLRRSAPRDDRDRFVYLYL